MQSFASVCNTRHKADELFVELDELFVYLD